MSDDFQALIISILPQLRLQALALTHNPSEAEDLVQDAICSALSAQNSFTMGTNFRAWMYRIVRNRFISNLRKKRQTLDINSIPDGGIAIESHSDDYLTLKGLTQAMERLSNEQRQALRMIVIDGLSYEELAEATQCAVGTAKSRVFRARRQLSLMLVERGAENTEAVKANV